MRKTAEKRLAFIDRLAVAPYSVWSVLFVVVPLIFVAYYAFTDDAFQFTFENLTRFFTETSGDGSAVPKYLLIFWRSLKLALIATAICLVLAYPLAYIMTKMRPKAQKTVMTLIMIPMWMNFLIRTYAWMTILKDTGIINNLLGKIGIDPIHIIGTESAVLIGMVYDYLPYMVLPIYSILAKMDDKLIEAARDLGCNGFSVFRRVIFPLSLPGVVSGITMVLIPSISTFYISQKLGSGHFYLIGDAIETQYVSDKLHFAAAIAFILMVILLAAMAVMQYFSNRFANGGAEK